MRHGKPSFVAKCYTHYSTTFGKYKLLYAVAKRLEIDKNFEKKAIFKPALKIGKV